MFAEVGSIPARVWRCYVAAASSGAGAGMLLCALLLSAYAWLEQDFNHALVVGGLLYFFLITSLAVGRK